MTFRFHLILPSIALCIAITLPSTSAHAMPPIDFRNLDDWMRHLVEKQLSSNTAAPPDLALAFSNPELIITKQITDFLDPTDPSDITKLLTVRNLSRLFRHYFSSRISNVRRAWATAQFPRIRNIRVTRYSLEQICARESANNGPQHIATRAAHYDANQTLLIADFYLNNRNARHPLLQQSNSVNAGFFGSLDDISHGGRGLLISNTYLTAEPAPVSIKHMRPKSNHLYHIAHNPRMTSGQTITLKPDEYTLLVDRIKWMIDNERYTIAPCHLDNTNPG